MYGDDDVQPRSLCQCLSARISDEPVVLLDLSLHSSS